MSNLAELPNCLELLAGLACVQEQPERATTLFAAAAALRENMDLPLPPILRSGYQRDLTDARVALGSRRYATAWTRGSRMSMDELIQYARQMAAAITPKQSPSNPLSLREREIVALLANGHTNQHIAAQLIISERTVDGHVAHILDKLGLQTRAQAAVWAVQHQSLDVLSGIPPGEADRENWSSPAID
jgi:non-specific serine/threonine protein kinase